MAYDFKSGIRLQMDDIVLRSCKKVVYTDNFMSITEQTVAKVRAQKSCSTCNEDASLKRTAHLGTFMINLFIRLLTDAGVT